MRSMTQEGGDMACSELVGRQAGVIVARNVGATPTAYGCLPTWLIVPCCGRPGGRFADITSAVCLSICLTTSPSLWTTLLAATAASKSRRRGTLRTAVLFTRLRRFVYLAWRGAGRRAQQVYLTTGGDFNVSTTLEIRQQQSCIAYNLSFVLK